MRTFRKGKIRINPNFHQKKLLHNNKTNIVESSPLFLMSNFWCRQGEEIPNLYRVNAVASYTLLSHGWQQRYLLPSLHFLPGQQVAFLQDYSRSIFRKVSFT